MHRQRQFYAAYNKKPQTAGTSTRLRFDAFENNGLQAKKSYQRNQRSSSPCSFLRGFTDNGRIAVWVPILAQALYSPGGRWPMLSGTSLSPFWSENC